MRQLLAVALSLLLAGCGAGGALVPAATEAPRPLPPEGPTLQGHYRALAAADFDGDGQMDLAAADFLSGDILLWPGRKGMVWGPAVRLALGREVRGLVAEDVNRDGRPDLAVSYRGKEGGIGFFLNEGGFKFRFVAPGALRGPYEGFRLVDLDFDGRPDLVAARLGEGAEGGIRVWFNGGLDRWVAGPSPEARGPFRDVAVADLDLDGRYDLLGAGFGPQGKLLVWLGTPPRGWGRPNVLAEGEFWSLLAADLDGDGFLEVVAASRGEGIALWRGGAGGRLQVYPTPAARGGFRQVAALDRDGDKRLDLVASTAEGKGLRLFLNKGEGRWEELAGVLPGDGVFYGLLAQDLDGDGKAELAAAAHGGGVPLWKGFARRPEAAHAARVPEVFPAAVRARLARLAAAPPPSPAAPRVAPLPGAEPEKRLPGEYLIGPGDVLNITLWVGTKAEIHKVPVNERGEISFAFLEDIRTGGLTVRELDNLLTQRLRLFMKTPRVDIFVDRFQSRNVYLLGSVNRPAIYPLTRTMRLLDLVLTAGGHTTGAGKVGDLARVQVLREGRTQVFNLARAISQGDEAQNPVLQDRDTVFVPEQPGEEVERPNVLVLGEVKSPGVFPWSPATTMVEAIARAGGLSQFAVAEETKVIRGDLERPEILNADLNALLRRGDRRANILLQKNDVVFVPRSVIGDVHDFVTKLTPILTFFLYPSIYRDAYALNRNVLRFDVGGPSARTAELRSGGTFQAGAPTTLQLGR